MLDTITKYIETELLDPTAGVSLQADDDLLIVGMLSSLQFMRLIQHLETSLDISIPPEEMVLENFQTIDKIATYLNTEHGIS